MICRRPTRTIAADQFAQLGETWTYGPLLPIRVVLRRFAQQLPPGDEPARAGDLWNFVARDLHASGFGLSGGQLQEVGVGAINKRVRTRANAIRVADWLAASLSLHPDEGGVSAPQRASARDVLAALGDWRFDRERFFLPAHDLLGFVRIAADPEFRIGTRKGDAARVAKIIGRGVPDDEINDDLSPTPGFCIARYPVTVGQFKAFVDATGFSARVDCESRTAGLFAGSAGTRPWLIANG